MRSRSQRDERITNERDKRISAAEGTQPLPGHKKSRSVNCNVSPGVPVSLLSWWGLGHGPFVTTAAWLSGRPTIALMHHMKDTLVLKHRICIVYPASPRCAILTDILQGGMNMKLREVLMNSILRLAPFRRGRNNSKNHSAHELLHR
jgi:hypothetical protein